MRIGIVLAGLLLSCAVAHAADGGLGIFDGQSDVGAPTPAGAGSAQYDPATQAYTISGAGQNIWAATDAFHFVWTEVPATDFSLSANIAFAAATAGADPHRKAVLMIRQSLDADSPYADACIHGNGLTAIQWRDVKGGPTYETQAQANAPQRLSIEKRGDYFSVSFGSPHTSMHPAGGACKVSMTGTMYVGIGVCPHNPGRIETAVFSDVATKVPPPLPGNATRMISTLETVQISSRDRRAVCVLTQPGLKRAEAPNWSADGQLYFNNSGLMYRVKADLPAPLPPTAAAAEPQAVDLGLLTRINNDHGISFDGKLLAVSDQSQGNHSSAIWVLPIDGAGSGASAPRCVTTSTPSYFHGWSPDGKTLAFCGLRDKNFDIYTVSVDGGPETRLTDSPAKDDGPEYSPDGQFIYFNSDRTGSMQIWRMRADGSAQEQMTRDELNNWFPHLSPDGSRLAFLTYAPGVNDHPENKDVQLRLMDLKTGAISVLAKLFGGQGTMNVASWSHDSKYLAFMSYQIVPQ